MLFMKHAIVLNKNILFDMASFLVLVMMLGPLVNAVNNPFFQNQDEFIEASIKTQISDLFPEYNIEFEDVEVTSFFSLTPIEIKIQNMSISGPKANLILPESKFKFGVESIFFGGIPQSVYLNGVKILLDKVTTEKELDSALSEITDPNILISKLISGMSERTSFKKFPQKIQIIMDEIQMVELGNSQSGKIIISDASFQSLALRPDNLTALLSI